MIQAIGAAVEVPSARAALPAWDLLPPPSGAGAVVYDSRRHRELWLSTGGVLTVPDAPAVSWERVWAGTNPPHQFGEFVVYDSTSDRIWTASSSQQVGPTILPGKLWYMDLSAVVLQWTEVPYLGDAPMVGGYGYGWDPVRHRVLTFGGYSLCPACDPTTDAIYSLALDGTPTWSRVIAYSGPAPSPRFGAAMTYDPWRDRMIVHGGRSSDPSFFDETWSLSFGDTMSWGLLPATGDAPPAREQQSAGTAVLDPIGHRWMIFGGTGPGGELQDTWALDLSSTAPADFATWSPIANGAFDPRPRLSRIVFCQPGQSRMLLSRGDLWALSLDADPAWSTIGGDSLATLSRQGFIAFLDPATRRLFAGLGNDDLLQVRSADVISWWETLPDHGPSARYRATVGVDEAGRRALVFGGSTYLDPYSGSEEFSELWSFDFDGTGWTRLTTSPNPAARTAALGVFDASHRRFIVHGGRWNSEGVQLLRDDTWSYDSADGTWSAVGGTGYGPRYGEMGFYDPVRDRIVAFGGFFSANSSFDFTRDVHVLPLGSSVGNWSEMSTSGPLPELFDGMGFACYDPVGDRMILVGKDSYAGGTVGVWQLTLDATPTWSKLAPDWVPQQLFQSGAAVFDALGDRMLLMGGSPEPGLWGLYLNQTPPTWISLVSAVATTAQVSLHWQAAEPLGMVVSVERRTAGGEWASVAQQLQDATGGITYVDDVVTAGTQYDYRLDVNQTGHEGHYGETRIAVPGTTGVPVAPPLALAGVRPNPTDGPLTVSFSLPSGAPATLSMYDVTGRRVMAQAVGGLGAGTHTLRLDSVVRLRTGLYFLRLEQGDEDSVARAVVAR